MADNLVFGMTGDASVAILANRSSGLTARTAEAVDVAVSMLAGHGFYPRLFMARRGGLEEALAACRAHEPDLVFVIGGDGTILAAAEAFLGTDTRLAIVPLGTVNQLARDLDIPLDPALAVASFVGGSIRAIDVGMVNGRAFLCTSVVGPLAKLQRYREQARGRLPATLLAIVTTILKAFRLRPMRLVLGDGARTWREDSRGVIVSVNPFLRQPSRIPRRASLDGGRLAIYAARDNGRLTLMKMAAAILAGRAEDNANIVYHEAPAIRIGARRRRITVLNDGEIRLLPMPLQFKLMPGALRVLAPGQSVAAPAAVVAP
ncbi:diacylglycerol/lipid kinase family protein [Phreatobacter stygius]|uniref:diacylglycerol/lipid kinase family protein n=1 Tax=Phreatobacter stygius TaxID=1940610 RepID=UPI001476B8F4|nr:diacylglycerol kinase family protein [Phreatobacter stygius]